MALKTLSKTEFGQLVEKLMASQKVVGPKRKETKFEFGYLSAADELVMDYDVTLRSPRTFFQPPKEKLFDFSLGANPEVKPAVSAEQFALVGVHTYDLKALNQMDFIWSENNDDQHYKARRSACTIIALEPTRASKWSFWNSMNAATVDKGFDLLLTDIGDKYVIEVGTKKGEELLSKFSKASDASDSDIKARDASRAKLATMCAADRKVKCDRPTLIENMRKSYDSPVWEKQAEKCYSCGSCNLVCPTCYCFDVKDTINLDMTTGTRDRIWDGCLLSRFARVGHGENFREHRADRFRHRILRKMVYVADKLGGELACVGCGRCSSACLPDITDPVKIVNEICS